MTNFKAFTIHINLFYRATQPQMVYRSFSENRHRGYEAQIEYAMVQATEWNT